MVKCEALQCGVSKTTHRIVACNTFIRGMPTQSENVKVDNTPPSQQLVTILAWSYNLTIIPVTTLLYLYASFCLRCKVMVSVAIGFQDWGQCQVCVSSMTKMTMTEGITDRPSVYLANALPVSIQIQLESLIEMIVSQPIKYKQQIKVCLYRSYEIIEGRGSLNLNYS